MVPGTAYLLRDMRPLIVDLVTVQVTRKVSTLDAVYVKHRWEVELDLIAERCSCIQAVELSLTPWVKAPHDAATSTGRRRL